MQCSSISAKSNMRIESLEFLRCPYCGGRFELDTSQFNQRSAGEIQDGILSCQCCNLPIVDGIPVLHLLPASTTALDQMRAAQPDRARRTMFGLDDEEQAEAFDAVAASSAATYRDTVEALGPNFEGGYFLYRFSDPTYLVAQAVVRAVASTVLGGSRRAVDICGGSGHVTRTLIDLTSAPPVLADLYFAKVWLARRFTAPGCEPVCCDGNAPMPFARGAFAFAMCTDAFMYIWTKRQFVGEMERLIEGRRPPASAPGAALIGHTHNERTWSPSHGQPLSPEGYAALFETVEPRVFGELGLFADIVSGGPLDLSRRDDPATLDANPALTIIASHDPRVFARHALPPAPPVSGELRLNPLYALQPEGERVRLRLTFPSEEYEEEYGACRQYLPEELTIDRQALAAIEAGRLSGDLLELLRRKVIVDLPNRYY
jgi:uncharacterized protein YbaR (Trm112 family)